MRVTPANSNTARAITWAISSGCHRRSPEPQLFPLCSGHDVRSLTAGHFHDVKHCIFASHLGTAQQHLDCAVTDDHAIAMDEVSAWNRNHQRQYTGTAGRIENTQIAVFLAYASPVGCAFLDRALYLPRAWTEDADRMASAGFPEEIAFATRPALRRHLIGRGVGYVLGRVPRPPRHHRDRSSPRGGDRRPPPGSARGNGYPPGPAPRDNASRTGPGHPHRRRPGQHRLLVRRNRSTGEVAFYRTWTPAR
jgi:hypothetical protein